LGRLAGQLNQAGRAAESERTYRTALEITRKRGLEEEWLAFLVCDLCAILDREKRHAEAEALIRGVVSGEFRSQTTAFNRITMRDNPLLLRWLTIALRAQHKHTEREQLILEELPHQNGHLRAAMFYELSSLLRAQKRGHELRKIAYGELKTVTKDTAEDRRYRLRLLLLLIADLNADKKYEEANELLSEALDLAAIDAQSALETEMLINAVASAPVSPGKLQSRADEEEEQLSRKMLAIAERSLVDSEQASQQMQLLISALTILAQILYKQGKFEEALVLNKRTLVLEQKLAQANATDGLVLAYFAIGKTQRRLGMLAEADRNLSAALAIAPAVDKCKLGSSTACNAALVLAEVRLEQGKIDDSECLIRDVAADVEKLPAKSLLHPLRLKLLGMISSEKGDLIKAEECFKQSIKTMESLTSVNNVMKSDVYLQYAALLMKLGRHAEANEWRQRAQPEAKLMTVSR
jgi:hypothetical protein